MRAGLEIRMNHDPFRVLDAHKSPIKANGKPEEYYGWALSKQ